MSLPLSDRSCETGGHLEPQTENRVEELHPLSETGRMAIFAPLRGGSTWGGRTSCSRLGAGAHSRKGARACARFHSGAKAPFDKLGMEPLDPALQAVGESQPFQSVMDLGLFDSRRTDLPHRQPTVSQWLTLR